MPSHRFQWNFAILKGLPQNSKRQTGFCFWFFSAGRYTAPPVFLGFHQGNRFKIGKCMKLSVRWYLANYTEGLHILLLHPKLLSHASISQFDWRLVNQRRQINDCVLSLFIQIFDSFEVKYLPLPESYNTNLNSPLSSIISSLKTIKQIFGHYRIFVLDAF